MRIMTACLFLGALLNRPFEAMVLIGLLSHFGVGWMLLTADRKQRMIQMTEEQAEQDLLLAQSDVLEREVGTIPEEGKKYAHG